MAKVRKVNGFALGIGVYLCKCCGRKTRSTIFEIARDDNEILKLCVQCYDLAGYENEQSDYGPLSERDQLVVKDLIGQVKKLGGSVEEFSCFKFLD